MALRYGRTHTRELYLERLVDDRAIRLLGSTEDKMKTIEKPREDVDGIPLSGDLKSLLAAEDHRLQHLVRRHVSFEMTRIPQFPHQFSKP